MILITGKRLQQTARAAGIPFQECVEWKRKGRFTNRVVLGIYVSPEDEPRMREAIASRNARRKTPAQKAAAREARQERDIAEFKARILVRFPSIPEGDAERCARHATEIGSGRVGRSSTADDPIFAAVAAYARHHHTNYDALLESGVEREDARQMVAGKVREMLETWQMQG